MEPLVDPDLIQDTSPPYILDLYRYVLNLVRDGLATYGRDQMDQLAQKSNRASEVLQGPDGGVVASHYLLELALLMLPLLSHMIRDDMEHNRSWTPEGTVIN